MTGGSLGSRRRAGVVLRRLLRRRGQYRPPKPYGVLVSLDGYEGEAANVLAGTNIGKRDSGGDTRYCPPDGTHWAKKAYPVTCVDALSELVSHLPNFLSCA